MNSIYEGASMKAKVYQSYTDKVVDHRNREDWHPVVQGTGFCGERYDDLLLSPLAREELRKATALIGWYQQFLWRVRVREAETTDMTAVNLIRSVCG